MEQNAKKYELKVMGSNSEMKTAVIKDADDAAKYARNFYHDDLLIYESCFVALLDKKNMVIGWAKISQGGVCGTTVDIKIICKYAVDTLCSGVILVHNHPSGSPKPSKEDINMTERFRNALRMFDISLLDHIVLAEDSYYSFANEE